MRHFFNFQGPLIHTLAGLLSPFWFYAWTKSQPDFRVLAACVLIALLPDIDSQASVIGRLFPFLSDPLERRFGHRQITHSLLAVGVVTAVTYLIFRNDWWLLTAAYGSHLFIDMLVGYTGIPLLWPFQARFYLLNIRPQSIGELLLGCCIGIGLLIPLFDTGRNRVARIIPQEDIALVPTFTPTPSPTPRIVTIRIQNVYDLDNEILISIGNTVQRGQLIANLKTHHQMIATVTPSPTPTATPTVTPSPLHHVTPSPYPTPDPLLIAQLENNLNLAQARYNAVIATTTPNPLHLSYIADLNQQIADRLQCIGNVNLNQLDWRAWGCKVEYEAMSTQVAILAATAAPQSADILNADIAYYQLQSAQIAYAQAIAQLTPQPTPTPTNTPTITPTPSPTNTAMPTSNSNTRLPSLPDDTQITAFITGEVISIQVVSVAGNAATIEIRLLVPYDPRYDPVPPTATHTPLATRHPSRIPAEVVRVIDGDTAVFRINNILETVRFLGVNAPETVHPDKPVECFGPEASEFVKSVLEVETAVYIELDEMTGERDKYGRLLAHIWLEDGTLFNELLLQEGYAEFANYGNETEKDGRYHNAQNYAITKKVGL